MHLACGFIDRWIISKSELENACREIDIGMIIDISGKLLKLKKKSIRALRFAQQFY